MKKPKILSKLCNWSRYTNHTFLNCHIISTKHYISTFWFLLCLKANGQSLGIPVYTHLTEWAPRWPHILTCTRAPSSLAACSGVCPGLRCGDWAAAARTAAWAPPGTPPPGPAGTGDLGRSRISFKWTFVEKVLNHGERPYQGFKNLW